MPPLPPQVFALSLTILAPFPSQEAPVPGAFTLERVAVVSTAGPGAEIVSLQPATRRAVLSHSLSGQVELFDLADLAAPRSVRVVDLGLAPGEEVTSVAFPPSGDWFLATIKAKGPLAPGRAQAHALTDGARLATFPCGAGPDCVAISPGGGDAVIANEGEGFDEVAGRLISPPGSLTHIRFAQPLSASRVTQIPFERAASAPTLGRTLERTIDGEERELPLSNEPDYIEPEVVVFLPDPTRVLVTLQENNAVAWVDLDPPKVTRLLSLGLTTHAADLVNDGRFDERGILVARREPDGISVTPDGLYFVTADEGDTGPALENPSEEHPAGGGRTLSVFELASGKLLGDTGPELDRLCAAADLYVDKRSPKRGCEPEMVVTFERSGANLAAVTLERAGALALVDLRDPAHPRAVAIARTGSDPLHDEPEGLAWYRDPESHDDYLYVANEGTGTLGVLRLPR